MKQLRFCAFGLAATLALVNLALVNVAAGQPRRRPLPPGAKALRDLPYVENGHERNRLDLYLPENAQGRLPLVVWIHGGAWMAGNKDNCPAVWLTGKGYAVASINYRLSQHAVFPAQIEDCKAAIRWLRANAGKYHLDPDRIGVWGASAGGHLVALLGTTGGVKEFDKGGNRDQSSRVQCVVDWFGPTDLLTIGRGRNNPDSPEARLIGGPVRDNKEKARKASPLTYVSQYSAPFLIMHGDRDNVVPIEQSKVLAEALKKAGVEVKLQIIEGNGHGGPGFNTPESRKLIEEFFDKHLKGKGGATDKTATAKPQKPRVLVTISKETTYITGPLRRDGYVNYVAALNERGKKGVTPENNAALLLWQAMGPSEIMPRSRARYSRMLGMEAIPEQGDYFVSFDHYTQRLKDAGDPRFPEPGKDGEDPGWDQLTQAMRRPWSKQEFPALAGWLNVNHDAMVLLIKASERSRLYDPLVCGDSDEGMVIAAPRSLAFTCRDAGRALVARAMMRLNDGHLDEAWDDLMACQRLARLFERGTEPIDSYSGIALDGMACTGEQGVLESATLTAPRIAKMRDDLARLPPMPGMADHIDAGERFTFLDAVAIFARDGNGCLMLLLGNTRPGSWTHSEFGEVVSLMIDWDLILRMGNSWFDRSVAACRKRRGTERRREVLGIENEMKAFAASGKDTEVFCLSLLTKGPRTALTERLSSTLTSLVMPALSASMNIEDRGAMQFDLTRLGFALAAYRADRGAYPDRLSELAPRYVAEVPTDIFANDAPLHYKRQGNGYLLYSVGINGRDDGGRGYDDRKNGEDWDDLSVRVP